MTFTSGQRLAPEGNHVSASELSRDLLRLELLDACGIPTTEPDPGLIVAAIDAPDAGDRFVAAIAKHRHFVRETDPPRV